MIENHKIKQDVLSFVKQYCCNNCRINLKTMCNQLSEWYMIDEVYHCLCNLCYDGEIELKQIGGFDYEICIAA